MLLARLVSRAMEQLSQHQSGNFVFLPFQKFTPKNTHTQTVHTHTITKIPMTGNGWSCSSCCCCCSCPVQRLELDWATRPHWRPLFKPHAAAAKRRSHDSRALRDCSLFHLSPCCRVLFRFFFLLICVCVRAQSFIIIIKLQLLPSYSHSPNRGVVVG